MQILLCKLSRSAKRNTTDKVCALIIIITIKSAVHGQCISCNCRSVIALGISHLRISCQTPHRYYFVHRFLFLFLVLSYAQISDDVIHDPDTALDLSRNSTLCVKLDEIVVSLFHFLYFIG